MENQISTLAEKITPLVETLSPEEALLNDKSSVEGTQPSIDIVVTEETTPSSEKPQVTAEETLTDSCGSGQDGGDNKTPPDGKGFGKQASVDSVFDSEQNGEAPQVIIKYLRYDMFLRVSYG